MQMFFRLVWNALQAALVYRNSVVSSHRNREYDPIKCTGKYASNSHCIWEFTGGTNRDAIELEITCDVEAFYDRVNVFSGNGRSPGFNVFDGVVVVISIIELLLSLFGVEGGGLAILRSLRLVRVFKLARSWTDLQTLLKTIMGSLSLRKRLVADEQRRRLLLDQQQPQRSLVVVPEQQQLQRRKRIYICSLPRTGTTILQRLLCVDTRHRAFTFVELKDPAKNGDPPVTTEGCTV